MNFFTRNMMYKSEQIKVTFDRSREDVPQVFASFEFKGVYYGCLIHLNDKNQSVDISYPDWTRVTHSGNEIVTTTVQHAPMDCHELIKATLNEALRPVA